MSKYSQFFVMLHKIHALYRVGGFPLVHKSILRRLRNRHDYARWVEKYDAIDDDIKTSLIYKIGNMSSPPLISILLPTFNSNIDWLIDAIESVRAQIYPHWELCIADDASTDIEVTNLLKQYSKIDVRIKVIFRNVNGHISAATNSALSISSGTWVGLLDHDDILAETALYWVADTLINNQDANLVYTDEDKISEKGSRSNPYFKPDWNRALFYSHNLICHLGVYKKSIIDLIGGFRIGLEGAQDYDLALRYIAYINFEGIYHIPRILYHWRVHSGSTAKTSSAKPYAMLAGKKALEDHFLALGIPVSVELIGHGYRIYYEVPTPRPLVTIIIPTRNGLTFLKNCIESIVEKTTYENYEIIVVDNGSDDIELINYLDFMRNSSNNFLVIKDSGPFNYSYLNNSAASFARGEILAFLNNDIEVIQSNWLLEMVGHAIQSDVAAVGAKLIYPNGTIQHAGITLGIGRWAGHAHKGFPKDSTGNCGRLSLASDFSAVTGACLVMRKSIFEKLSGFNQIDLKIACNDVDLCLRARDAGYRNVLTPFAELYHHESATRGLDGDDVKKARFLSESNYVIRRWEGLFRNDPMYNPNLTLEYEDFSLSWPPRVM